MMVVVVRDAVVRGGTVDEAILVTVKNSTEVSTGETDKVVTKSVELEGKGEVVSVGTTVDVIAGVVVVVTETKLVVKSAVVTGTTLESVSTVVATRTVVDGRVMTGVLLLVMSLLILGAITDVDSVSGNRVDGDGVGIVWALVIVGVLVVMSMLTMGTTVVVVMTTTVLVGMGSDSAGK